LANSLSSPGYLPATADVAADLLTVAAGAGLISELVACRLSATASAWSNSVTGARLDRTAVWRLVPEAEIGYRGM